MLTLLLHGGILVLLVLADQVVHVGLSLSELHLVHTLTGVPALVQLESGFKDTIEARIHLQLLY